MRGVPRAPGNLPDAFELSCNAENRSRSLENPRQRAGIVEIEAEDLPEPVPQGRSQQAGPRGRADQRETFQIKLDRPRRRTLADHDVDLIILHRWIKHFLDYVIEPVNLVDEEHVAFIEIGEQS